MRICIGFRARWAWSKMSTPRRTVLGYNLSKRGNGVDLTVAHGGWFSEGHGEYARFTQLEVLGVPAGMLGLPSVHGDPSQPREITVGRGVRNSANTAPDIATPQASGKVSGGDPVVEREKPDDLDPPGYTVQSRLVEASGRRYSMWRAPNGELIRSRRQAWAHYVLHGRPSSSQEHAVSSSQEAAPLSGAPSPAPAAPAPAARLPRSLSAVTSDSADAASLGSGASAPSFVEFSLSQCSNPLCKVASVNGTHNGLCIFDEPAPRRRAQRER